MIHPRVINFGVSLDMLQIIDGATLSVEYLFHRDFTSKTRFPFYAKSAKKNRTQDLPSAQRAYISFRWFFFVFFSLPESECISNKFDIHATSLRRDRDMREIHPVRSTREASPVYFRNKIILSRAGQKYGLSILFLR